MRIGMMADIYEPHVSGITNYIKINKTHLERVGHEVFVFAFGEAADTDDKLNIIHSPGLPLPDTGYYLNYHYSRKAKALLQSMDLVHVHHPFLSGRLALRYCRPLRIPVIFTNHTRYDLYAQAYLPMLPEEISTTLLQNYMPHFCAAVDMVIAPSQGMAMILRQLGVSSPIEVIPNGVEIHRFHKVCENCRSEYGYDPGNILMVYSGRLAPEKNLEFLIQTFVGVAEALPDVHLIIVGGGPQEESLRQLAARTSVSKRIRFTGMIPYEKLPPLLAMCDIFVTASITEVHPLSVIEAMASGLPAIGLHSVGVGDTVEDGITGFLARNDGAAFASMMTRLCLEKPLREKMKLAARKASEKYSIEHTLKLVLDKYEQLVFDTVRQKRGFLYRLRALTERFRV